MNMAEFYQWGIRVTEVILVWYSFLLNVLYLGLAFIAFRIVTRHCLRNIYGGFEDISKSPLTPAITVLVPAHNEAVGICTTVNNLLHADFMRFEVIVINDGSTDGTIDVLKKTFRLTPDKLPAESALPTETVRAVYHSATNHNLIVIDKRNGGKSDALNAGLNLARYPYFCTVDADAMLEPDALQRVIRPVVESPVRVIAVGGIVRIANGCRIEKGRVAEVDLPWAPLPIFQIVEYFRAFLCGRTGLSHINALMIISGAFGLFERSLVMEIGGYKVGTVGEDMDLVTRLHDLMVKKGERDYGIEFVPDPVCWTESPTSLRVLTRQRRRWQKGLLEVLADHSHMCFNIRYGWLGMFGYPFLLIFEGWGILIETLGYLVFVAGWWIDAIQSDFMVAYFICAVLGGTLLSLTGIMLGEMTPREYPKFGHWFRLIAYAIIENFGYRQMISFLRLAGTMDFLMGRGEWGRMEREGLSRRRTRA
ncbi:MAG: glycosyltransferase family 2 protein [Elusimicrobia bacterium]|nr:glycosyltransferase family 2 protein [Elusimicrobiota bacterium]